MKKRRGWLGKTDRRSGSTKPMRQDTIDRRQRKFWGKLEGGRSRATTTDSFGTVSYKSSSHAVMNRKATNGKRRRISL